MHTSELAEPLGPISPRELLAHYARQTRRHALVREPSSAFASAVAPAVARETLSAPQLELSPPNRRTRRRFAVPAWFISLLVHFAGLSILATLSIVPLALARIRIIEVAQLAEPLQVETLDEISMALAPSRRSASTGPAGKFVAAARPVNVDELSLTPVEISFADWDQPAGKRGPGGFGGGSLQTLLNTPAGSGQTAQFFGLQAHGGKFVFIVDNSRSMNGGKFVDAKVELSSAIHRLSSDQSFYVIFFSGTTVCMTFAPHAAPEPAPVAATSENFALFDDWMATIPTMPNTDPTDALRIAVEMSPDAIFLLSDGEFAERSRTLRYLTAHNRELNKDSSSSSRFTPKVTIHTIAFWENVGEKTMRLIARTNGGDFRFIPPPRSFTASRH
jgi:hypothetical protein